MPNSLPHNGKWWQQHDSFWRLTAGNLLALVAMLGSLTVFLLSYERRVSKIENTEEAILNTEAQIKGILQRMDAEGTYKGQVVVAKTMETLNDTIRRLEQDEVNLHQMTPKLERLITQMEWIQLQREHLQKDPGPKP